MKSTIGSILLLSLANAFNTWSGGPTFKIVKKDSTYITLSAEVPTDKYLIIAFGSAKSSDVDMVYFGGKAQNNCKDMYGKEGVIPTADTQSNIESCTASEAAGTYSISFDRKLSTGDASQDTTLTCGKDYTMEWLGSDTSADLQTT